MKYTFEVTISGCSVSCLHCYVNGGMSNSMSLNNYIFLINKLKPVLDKLNEDISITLGNEIFCNPNISEIIDFSRKNIPEYFSYNGFPIPSTGMALVNRKDREEIIDRIQTVGADQFMFTLHGKEDHHNFVVKNPNAYNELFKAVDFLKKNNFGILFNIIINKYTAQDFDEAIHKISKLSKELRLTVPLYVPTARMRKFQEIRAGYSDCIKLADIADRYNIDTNDLRIHATKHSEHNVIKEIENGFDYDKEKRNAEDWIFFNITQELDIFYGNAGAHTIHIGNLKNMSIEELYSSIKNFGSNCDYNAFYDDRIFYSLNEL